MNYDFAVRLAAAIGESTALINWGLAVFAAMMWICVILLVDDLFGISRRIKQYRYARRHNKIYMIQHH